MKLSSFASKLEYLSSEWDEYTEYTDSELEQAENLRMQLRKIQESAANRYYESLQREEKEWQEQRQLAALKEQEEWEDVELPW